MSENLLSYNDPKITKDLSNEVQSLISFCSDLAINNKDVEIHEKVTDFEKLARNICIWYIDYLNQKKEYNNIITWIDYIFSKRMQSKQIHIEVINHTFEIAKTLSGEIMFKLINSLESYTLGKLYLEIQRTRILLHHAKIIEKEFKFKEALELLQTAQIDSNVHIEEDERAYYLLYQVKLAYKLQDFSALNICCKKINRKNICDGGYETIYLIYLYYLITYYDHMGDYHEVNDLLLSCSKIDIANVDFDMLESYELSNTITKCEKTLLSEKFIVQAAMSALLIKDCYLRISRLKSIISAYHRILKNYPDLLKVCEIISLLEIIEVDSTKLEFLYNSDFFREEFPVSNKVNKKDLIKEVLINNMIIATSQYYSEANIKGLAALINVSTVECENILCDIIRKNVIKARVDDVNSTVKFEHDKLNNPLSNWIDGTCNMIEKLKECIDLIDEKTKDSLTK